MKTRTLWLITTIMLLATQIASSAELPKDVSTFVARRGRCDHFRGEDAADAARQAEIALALTDTCRGTDAELARLLRRHAHEPAIRDRLKAYDPTIEGGPR